MTIVIPLRTRFYPPRFWRHAVENAYTGDAEKFIYTRINAVGLLTHTPQKLAASVTQALRKYLLSKNVYFKLLRGFHKNPNSPNLVFPIRRLLNAVLSNTPWFPPPPPTPTLDVGSLYLLVYCTWDTGSYTATLIQHRRFYSHKNIVITLCLCIKYNLLGGGNEDIFPYCSRYFLLLWSLYYVINQQVHISTIFCHYSPACFGRFCDHHQGVTREY
jgi:hypothetical protein